MTTKEILQGALALFGPNGENWRNRVPEAENEYCAASAMGAVASEDEYERARIALIRQINGPKVTEWNDHSTWPEVKAAFEKAIEAC